MLPDKNTGAVAHGEARDEDALVRMVSGKTGIEKTARLFQSRKFCVVVVFWLRRRVRRAFFFAIFAGLIVRSV